jgi:hypothetical protein
MHKSVLFAGVWALCLGACADEGTPSGTAGETMVSGTSPTTTNTMSGEESGDTSDDDAQTSDVDPPGTTTDEPDPTSASTDPSGEASSGGAETSGGALGSVRGVVVRTIEPAAGNDGIGDLYVGLLAECAQDAPTVGDGDQIVGADLSAPGATVMYEIPNVPDGTFYVVAFLDDNQNADPVDGGPDMGDIVTAEGFGPGCVEVTVSGGNSAVAPSPVELNFLYPF